MTHLTRKPLVVVFAIAVCGLLAGDVQAGPLLDWLFGRRQTAPAYPVGTPVPLGNGYAPSVAGYAPSVADYASLAPGYVGNYGTYYSSQLPTIGPAGAGYTAALPSGIAAASLPIPAVPPTVSYVPNYQTYAQRAPITYYRPLLTTDPTTGAQVVAMAPCTSYEYMAQRVPTWGRSALFGTNAPPVLPTQPSLPAYTLPSGGIPLAYSSPALTAPYSAAYAPAASSRNYAGSASTNFPPGSIAVQGQGAGNYPTAPQGYAQPGQAYYGSPSGGSCGGYVGPTNSWQTIPGLAAPQAPATNVPGYSVPTTPGLGSPPPNVITPIPGSVPGTGGYPAPSSGVPGGVFPPSGSVDPADQPPHLPAYPSTGASAQSNLRPQLRGFTRQPASESKSTVGNTPSGRESDNLPSGSLPSMLPIPAPEEFQHHPKWSPALLRDGDMTAMARPLPGAVEVAGQSKAIQWASFETEVRYERAVARGSSTPSGQLRPILNQPAFEIASPQPSHAVGSEGNLVRQTGGWKVARP